MAKKRTLTAKQRAGLALGKGRPMGCLNKATVEVKEATSALVDSPAYRLNLKERLEAGALAPAIEAMLWYYAKGKPKETVAIEGTLQTATDADLRTRLAVVLERL